MFLVCFGEPVVIIPVHVHVHTIRHRLLGSSAQLYSWTEQKDATHDDNLYMGMGCKHLSFSQAHSRCMRRQWYTLTGKRRKRNRAIAILGSNGELELAHQVCHASDTELQKPWSYLPTWVVDAVLCHLAGIMRPPPHLAGIMRNPSVLDDNCLVQHVQFTLRRSRTAKGQEVAGAN